MTTITKKKFTQKVKEDANPDAVRVSPRDIIDTLILVKVNEFKDSVITKHAPGGTPAIALDLVSVETGSVALDQLWFNGALVDGFKDYVGEVVPCRLGWVPSKSGGYPYLAVQEISDADDQAVDLFIANNPNIFDKPGSETPPASERSPAASAPAAKPRW